MQTGTYWELGDIEITQCPVILSVTIFMGLSLLTMLLSFLRKHHNGGFWIWVKIAACKPWVICLWALAKKLELEWEKNIASRLRISQEVSCLTKCSMSIVHVLFSYSWWFRWENSLFGVWIICQNLEYMARYKDIYSRGFIKHLMKCEINTWQMTRNFTRCDSKLFNGKIRSWRRSTREMSRGSHWRIAHRRVWMDCISTRQKKENIK